MNCLTTKMYGLLTKCSGQDDWILAKFFFCVFMDEVHKLAKKERGQYPAFLYVAFGEILLAGYSR